MRRQEIEKLRLRARVMTDDLGELFGTDDRRDISVTARVALRRMVGRSPEDPAARAAHSYLARYIREDDSAAVERAFYAVAAMIAAQPREAREARKQPRADQEVSAADVPQRPVKEAGAVAPGGLVGGSASEKGAPKSGTSLGIALGTATAAGVLGFEPIESRLLLLCRQGIAGIHRQMPRLITRLRTDLVPVDWAELTVDLARWGGDRDYVAKRWLQDFYRTHNKIVAVEAKRKIAADGARGDTTNDEGEER